MDGAGPSGAVLSHGEGYGGAAGGDGDYDGYDGIIIFDFQKI